MVFQFDFGSIPSESVSTTTSTTSTSTTTVSPSTEYPFCDPIHIGVSGFDALSSHKISNLMLGDVITNITHRAILENALKYGIHSGSFRVQFGSAFGRLSIVE